MKKIALMKKVFCSYCGELLTNNCDCEKHATEQYERLLEEYENSPEIQEGWRQQDMIDMQRSER